MLKRPASAVKINLECARVRVLTWVISGGSIIVKQIGHAILTVDTAGKKEEYLITLPRLRIDGLWLVLSQLEGPST
jgi:hypothetical protein